MTLNANPVIRSHLRLQELAAHPGVSLSEAVRGYLEILSTRKASIPFGELFRRFLQAKAGKSTPYLNHLKWALQQFLALG